MVRGRARARTSGQGCRWGARGRGRGEGRCGTGGEGVGRGSATIGGACTLHARPRHTWRLQRASDTYQAPTGCSSRCPARTLHCTERRHRPRPPGTGHDTSCTQRVAPRRGKQKREGGGDNDNICWRRASTVAAHHCTSGALSPTAGAHGTNGITVAWSGGGCLPLVGRTQTRQPGCGSPDHPAPPSHHTCPWTVSSARTEDRCQATTGAHTSGHDAEAVGCSDESEKTDVVVGILASTSVAKIPNNGNWPVANIMAKLGSSPPPHLSQSFPNYPILSPSQPCLVPRDTQCSCEAYGMRPTNKERRRKMNVRHSPCHPGVESRGDADLQRDRDTNTQRTRALQIAASWGASADDG